MNKFDKCKIQKVTLLHPFVKVVKLHEGAGIEEKYVVLLKRPLAGVGAQEGLGLLKEVNREGDVQLLESQQQLANSLKRIL